MSDLTAFLLARIAEDEREAGDADEQRLWRWSQHDRMIINDAGHMQRFTPSRMLRECEAKQRIVERHADCGLGYGYCDDGGKGIWREEDGGPACADLFDVASVYVDHPDYVEAWRL